MTKFFAGFNLTSSGFILGVAFTIALRGQYLLACGLFLFAISSFCIGLLNLAKLKEK